MRALTSQLQLALALLTLALLSAPAHARADVRLDVRTDRRSLSLDETLTVQITVEARGGGKPEVTLPAFEGFEVISEQEQRPTQLSYSSSKGMMVQSSVILTLVLRPLRAGALVIKPVSVELEGQRRASAPLSITVSAGRAPQASGEPSASSDAPVQNASTGGGLDLAQVEENAFLRVVADKAKPYVGEQVTVTMYLYLRNRVQASPAFELEPTTDGFWVHDLIEPGQQPKPQRQIVQGAQYTVYPLRRFAAFPLRAGALSIGPLGLRIDTTSLFDVFSQRRGETVLQRRSAPLGFEVKELPASDAKGPIAVGRFELEAKLDRDQTATGDAVTLTVAVRGQGNVRNVSLPTPQLQGLDVLEPEVRDLIEAPNDRVGGTRELRFLIVPRAPGHYTLPAFGFDAFDPQTEKHSRIESKPLVLDVAGNPIAAAPSAPAAEEPAQADAPPPVPDHEWRPIRTQSALLRRRAPLATEPWFIPLLVTPALLYAGWSVLRGARRRAEERAQTATHRADRDARDKLASAASAAERNDAAAFFAAAAGSVLATLEARLEAPATGHTHGELRRYLVERGMDETLAREVVELLQRADTHRFGGSSTSASLSAELVALRGLRERLAGFSPRRMEAA
jgi:hypothetical protein